MKLQRFGLCLVLALALNAQANDGYIAVQGHFGQLLMENDGSYHASYGGWILGGDESARGGAAGYKLMSAYESPTYGDISLWAAGPMVFWIPEFDTDEVVVHIGAMFGGGLASATNVTRQKFFWFIEPTIMLAFRMTSFVGIGVGANFRYIPNFGSASMLDDISYTFGANLSLILGDF
jgi:hypothetical protein